MIHSCSAACTVHEHIFPVIWEHFEATVVEAKGGWNARALICDAFKRLSDPNRRQRFLIVQTKACLILILFLECWEIKILTYWKIQKRIFCQGRFDASHRVNSGRNDRNLLAFRVLPYCIVLQQLIILCVVFTCRKALPSANIPRSHSLTRQAVLGEEFSRRTSSRSPEGTGKIRLTLWHFFGHDMRIAHSRTSNR